MKNKNGSRVFDWIVIILGTSYGVSILSQVFYIPSIGMVVPLCLFVIFSHLFRFGLRFPVLKKILVTPIFFLFFSILLLDFLQSLIYIGNGGNVGNASARVVYQFFFFSYIYNLLIERGFESVFKPYSSYAIYNVIVIILMAALIFAGIPWMQNPLGDNVQILVEDIEGAGGIDTIYYFPYYISVVAQYHLYSLFTILPGITGLTHEPHVLMWIITPPMIMTLAFKNKPIWKYLFILFFFFILLEAFSTMAFICIVPIILFHVLWRGKFTGKIGSAVLIVLGAIFLLLSILLTFKDEIQIITDVVSQKATKGDGSFDYSTNMLGYLFSFDSLFGYGNLPTATGDVKEAVFGHQSAGIITGFMDILLFVILFIKSLKLSWKNDKSCHFIGLGCMYLLMHGLKVNYIVFGYPLFSLFILILYAASYSNGRYIMELSEKSLYN